MCIFSQYFNEKWQLRGWESGHGTAEVLLCHAVPPSPVAAEGERVVCHHHPALTAPTREKGEGTPLRSHESIKKSGQGQLLYHKLEGGLLRLMKMDASSGCSLAFHHTPQSLSASPMPPGLGLTHGTH